MVQIGTKDGADEFNKMVKESNPSMVILVEPNQENNEKIFRNYECIPNVYLENVAITAENCGIVKLVHPKKVGDVIYDSGKVFSFADG